MHCENSVTNLIASMKAGESEGTRQLWERYFGRLVQTARQKLGNAPRRVSDEEDIVVSVFDSLFDGAAQGRFNKLTDRHDLWMLLLVMVKQKTVDQLRFHGSQKRGGSHVRGESVFQELEPAELGRGLETIAAEEPTPELLAQLDEEFQHSIQRLPNETLRRIATLRMAGYSNEEIAAEMCIALRSVERKLQLIRKEWSQLLVQE